MSRIGRNVFALGIGEVLSRLLSLPLFVILAKHLGPGNFGVYATAAAYASILGTLCDFGVENLLVMKIARDVGKSRSLLGTTVVLKLVLGVVCVGPLYPALRMLDYPEGEVLAITVYCASLFFLPLHTTLTSLFKAHEKMEYVGAFNVLRAALRLAVLAPVVILTGSVLLVATSHLVVSAVLSILLLVVATRKFGLPQRPENPRDVAQLAAESVPFLLVSLVYMANYRTDVLMLSLMSTKESVGLYSAPNELLQVLYVLPTLLASAMFPAMARAYHADPGELRRLSAAGMRIVTLAAAPAAIGITVVARPIVEVFFGAGYEGSVVPLQILGLGLLFGFPDIILSQAITAADRVKVLLGVNLASIVVNVLLNAILIPMYGERGTAAATVVSLGLGFCVCLWVLRGLKLGLQVLTPMARPMLAGLVMGAVLFWMGTTAPLWASVGIGAAVYLIAAFCVGAIQRDDLAALRSFLPSRRSVADAR
jgi:O-antigen/teichoic acid export membrane protein